MIDILCRSALMLGIGISPILILLTIDYTNSLRSKNQQKVSLDKTNDEEAKYKLPKSYEEW